MLAALALAFTLFRPPPTSGPYARDFEAYYAAGAAWNAGLDPYSRDVWRFERAIAGVEPARDELLPFVGPAATLPLWSLLARLPQPVAVRIWTGMLSGAFFIVVFSALALARAPRDPLTVLVAVALGLASGPTISDVALGQIALVSAAALAAALLAYRSRNLAGAFAATLIAAVQPNLALALFARIRSRWSLAVAAAAAAAFGAITLAAGGGIDGVAAYAHRLGEHGAAERFVTIQHTPAAVAYGFGAPQTAAVAIGAAIGVLAVGATAFAIVRASLNPTDASLLAFTALPLAMPFFHQHDFVLELVPVIVLAITSRGATRAAAAVAAVLVLTDWFGFAQREPAHAQLVCLSVAVGLGFAALGRPPRREQRSALAGVLAALVVGAFASPLARAHPAPTWPDTLPAAYRAASSANASAVWADEQRVAGLTARDPVWGVLRALPLGGCILLGAALLSDARRRRRANAQRFVPLHEALRPPDPEPLTSA